jgi:hypothetical protein
MSAFNHTLINNIIIFMGMMGGVFLLPIFAQTYLGYNATQTGFLFMPMAAGLMFAAPIGASLTGRVKPSYVIALSTFGAGVGLYLFTGLDARSGPLDIAIPILVMSFCMGFGMAQRTNVIASIVPDNEMGMASSTLALARNIAGAFGIAVFSTILKEATENHVLTVARNTAVNSMDPLLHAQVTALIVLKAQIAAYHTVFIVAAALLFVGAPLALLINVTERSDAGHVFVE